MATQQGAYYQLVMKHTFRQVYWIRYVTWIVVVPMLSMVLGLLAGISPLEIVGVVVASVPLGVLGWFAATSSPSHYQWGKLRHL